MLAVYNQSLLNKRKTINKKCKTHRKYLFKQEVNKAQKMTTKIKQEITTEGTNKRLYPENERKSSKAKPLNY